MPRGGVAVEWSRTPEKVHMVLLITLTLGSSWGVYRCVSGTFNVHSEAHLPRSTRSWRASMRVLVFHNISTAYGLPVPGIPTHSDAANEMAGVQIARKEAVAVSLSAQTASNVGADVDPSEDPTEWNTMDASCLHTDSIKQTRATKRIKVQNCSKSKALVLEALRGHRCSSTSPVQVAIYTTIFRLRHNTHRLLLSILQLQRQQIFTARESTLTKFSERKPPYSNAIAT